MARPVNRALTRLGRVRTSEVMGKLRQFRQQQGALDPQNAATFLQRLRGEAKGIGPLPVIARSVSGAAQDTVREEVIRPIEGADLVATVLAYCEAAGATIDSEAAETVILVLDITHWERPLTLADRVREELQTISDAGDLQIRIIANGTDGEHAVYDISPRPFAELVTDDHAPTVPMVGEYGVTFQGAMKTPPDPVEALVHAEKLAAHEARNEARAAEATAGREMAALDGRSDAAVVETVRHQLQILFDSGIIYEAIHSEMHDRGILWRWQLEAFFRQLAQEGDPKKIQELLFNIALRISQFMRNLPEPNGDLGRVKSAMKRLGIPIRSMDQYLRLLELWREQEREGLVTLRVLLYRLIREEWTVTWKAVRSMYPLYKALGSIRPRLHLADEIGLDLPERTFSLSDLDMDPDGPSAKFEALFREEISLFLIEAFILRNIQRFSRAQLEEMNMHNLTPRAQAAIKGRLEELGVEKIRAPQKVEGEGPDIQMHVVDRYGVAQRLDELEIHPDDIHHARIFFPVISDPDYSGVRSGIKNFPETRNFTELDGAIYGLLVLHRAVPITDERVMVMHVAPILAGYIHIIFELYGIEIDRGSLVRITESRSLETLKSKIYFAINELSLRHIREIAAVSSRADVEEATLSHIETAIDRIIRLSGIYQLSPTQIGLLQEVMRNLVNFARLSTKSEGTEDYNRRLLLLRQKIETAQLGHSK